MRTDDRYNPSHCFDTFPFPATSHRLDEIGAAVETHRLEVMLTTRLGLTPLYNRFHDRDDSATDIRELRTLHIEMDQAVAAAYGWDDLKLGHDFHPTKQGERFSISEPARREVLQRLLKLNHDRHTEEVEKGLEKNGKTKKPGAGKGRRKVPGGPSLFGNDDDEGG